MKNSMKTYNHLGITNFQKNTFYNSQIGMCNNREENIIGKYGHGKRSKNGERLVTLVLEDKLRMLKSFYKK